MVEEGQTDRQRDGWVDRCCCLIVTGLYSIFVENVLDWRNGCTLCLKKGPCSRSNCLRHQQPQLLPFFFFIAVIVTLFLASAGESYTLYTFGVLIMEARKDAFTVLTTRGQPHTVPEKTKQKQQQKQKTNPNTTQTWWTSSAVTPEKAQINLWKTKSV